MTAVPTPAEFLAQPFNLEEDLEPAAAQDYTALPIESIADSLQLLVKLLHRQEAAVESAEALLAERNELAELLDRVQGESDAKSALLDQILAICKPSTSKLANSIREAFVTSPPAPDAAPTEGDQAYVEVPSCEARIGDVWCDQAEHAADPETGLPVHAGGRDTETESRVQWVLDSGPVAPVTPAPPAENKGTAFELGPNASVADWRAYARMFGHTDVDEAEIPQIRTLLGLPDPEAHNHDFRSGSTPNSCACGFVLPGAAGVPA